METSSSKDNDTSEEQRRVHGDRRDGGGPKWVGFERPSLLQDFRNILQEYPDNGQIFKEMFQNAEDAGAGIVKIVSVTSAQQHLKVSTERQTLEVKPSGAKQETSTGKQQRKSHKKKKQKSVDSSSPWRPPLVDVFSMPGLIVYNDAEFTPEDWRGIRKLHDSVKVKDPLKVGRFGLGFKSVFHLTDHPIIVSDEQLLFMDPFREENEAVLMMQLSDLHPEERQALRDAITPLLHKLDAHTLTEKAFKGTVFWFPLRQEKSELSDTLYTHERIQQLKQALRMEINTMLLFLKKLERIEIYSCDYMKRSSVPAFDFSVGLKMECLQAVRTQRQEFMSAITTRNKACPQQEASTCSYLVLESCENKNGRKRQNQECWLVVHFHQGLNDMSSDLRDLCQRKSLSHRPYVGVAARVGSTPETLQGQLFCFLPLPPEKPSPTGLPIHVHGFFELSQNRCHVKWAASESEEDCGPIDEALLWNKLLVSECLPRAYVVLLTELASRVPCTDSAPSPDMPCPTADTVYQLWPNRDSVTNHWQPLLTPLYQTLSQHRLFFTANQGGFWVCLEDAVLMPYPASDLSKAMEEAIVHVYQICDVSLVQLPQHVIEGLKLLQPGHEDRRRVTGVAQSGLESITLAGPENLSGVMKRKRQWSERLTSKRKLLILDYLCRCRDSSLLQDLQLLPMADGSFCAWCDQQVYVCRDEGDLRLLRGLRHQLCFVSHPPGLQNHLENLAEQGFGHLSLITDDLFPHLLKDSIEKEHRTTAAEVTISQNDPWIRDVWKYLQDQDLQAFDQLPLLPCPCGDKLVLRPVQGNYVCKTLDGFTSASIALSSALSHLGVRVLQTLPEFVLQHKQVLHSRVQAPTCIGVLRTLTTLSEKPARDLEDAVYTFNCESTAPEHDAVVDILSSKELKENRWDAAKRVLRRLKLFCVWPKCIRLSRGKRDMLLCLETSEAPSTSVEENSRMTPDVSFDAFPPPVSICPELLYCDSPSGRHLALALGAQQISLEDLVGGVLRHLSSPSHRCSDEDVVDFMTYFIKSDVFTVKGLANLAQNVSFLPPLTPERLFKVEELYDPEDPLLQNLFAGENRFPSKSFYENETSILPRLKQLGLLNVSSVTETHLISVAEEIDESLKSGGSCSSLAEKKAKALWHFLLKYGQKYSDSVIRKLACLQCLPCMTRKEVVPADYPSALPVCPSDFEHVGVAKVVDMCDNSQLYFIGSVRPVSLPADSECVFHSLFYTPSLDDFIEHLKVITANFSNRQSQYFAVLLRKIYRLLAQKIVSPENAGKMEDIRCVMIEGQFRRACELWVPGDNAEEDVLLAPYRFPLPLDLINEGLTDFFVACGCCPVQDVTMLRGVLQEIRTKHLQPPPSRNTCRNDRRLVQKILKAVKEKGVPKTGDILLPVYHENDAILQMELANRCTVAPDPDFIPTLLTLDEAEDLIFVHPALDKDVALAMGAFDLRSRTLTGVTDLKVVEDDSEFGQYEPLTTRLRNLLQDGYTDGFSIPKELMQNADDARAKVVKFLLDERENRNWRSGLLTPALSDFQGPALWVFNDAQFSAADFSNLCKLGGATKKEDCSKVGKFGLGFNAVYNLTDLPSLYSNDSMAILDPHETHLGGKRGQKMNFNDIMNKLLLKQMPKQFQPFQGVFNCDILNPDWKPYSGTLFRFPFRTESQAGKSDICKEEFTKERQKDFKNSLIDKGGNLMLFLQHVTRLELYHLAKNCKDPARTQQFAVITRASEPDMNFKALDNCSVLDHISTIWRAAVEQGSNLEEQKLVEMVTLSREIPGKRTKQQCVFCVAWATGKRESCDIARETREEGFVPLAAVGIPVDVEENVVNIKSCPEGFYKTGHLYCFLPLAQEVSQMNLPVHINAPFALSSDRRGLLCETEDDRKVVSGRWNTALFSDPIPRAYLAALERVAQSKGKVAQLDRQVMCDRYYNLWPQKSAAAAKSPQSALFPSFFRLLVQEEFHVFLHPLGIVPFSSARFLEPKFQLTQTGQAAFRVLQMFWSSTRWGCSDEYLIDLPWKIASNIASREGDAFTQRVITEECFFREVLFPRVAAKDTGLVACDRNQLVLHALLSDKQTLQELVRSHCCIPCVPDGSLKAPACLINPRGKAAMLYVEEDGRFPKQEDDADFTSQQALCRLLHFGMVGDKVSKEELIKRAQSVKKIATPIAMQRAKAIIKYLPTLEKDASLYMEELTNIPFLPSLRKPNDWPVSWFVDVNPGHDFVQPSEMFAKKMMQLVGCMAAVLDEERLDLFSRDWKTLEELGVTCFLARASKRGVPFTLLVMNNLLCIAREAADIPRPRFKDIGAICSSIYKYFDSTYFERHASLDKHREALAELRGQAVVWTDGTFMRAEQLAFEPRENLKPYLRVLDSSLTSFCRLFKFLGVKQWFSVNDILEALKHIQSEKSSRKLKRADVGLILKISGLLTTALQIEGRPALNDDETSDLQLPGRDQHLHPVRELCLNDCDWLMESETMCFLHPDFSESLATIFRVRTKRDHDEDEYCESFGQKEELTTRINRLLENYTRDMSIFKELLQNADDAGATEVTFVKDYRHHSTERLLQESWKEVFGPALCVFNNACFTNRDMKGIQALGEGSKEGDAVKTGKYGVGFNAVYNLTDMPCFCTTVKQDPEDTTEVKEKELGEKICLFDPNFFVVCQRSRLPGKQISITERFKQQYSSMLSPFQLGEITEAQTGTVFRLPLRSKEKAGMEELSVDPRMTDSPMRSNVHTKSKIKQPSVSMEEVEELLKEFQGTMGESLLFLSHVKKVSVYTARHDGTMVRDYQTQLSTSDRSHQKKQDFFAHVRREAKKLKNQDVLPQLENFAAMEVAVQCCLYDFDCKKEDWLVVHKFGLTPRHHIPSCLQHPQFVQKHRLLPLGGVAICLSAQHELLEDQLAASKACQLSQFQQWRRKRSTTYLYETRDSSRNLLDRYLLQYPAVSNVQKDLRCPSTSSDQEESNDTPQRVFQAYCQLPLPVITGLPVHVNARFALDHETRRNLDTRPDQELVKWNYLLADEVIVPAYITALKEITHLCFSVEGYSLSQNQAQDSQGEAAETHGCRSILTGGDIDCKLKHYNSFLPKHQEHLDAFWNQIVTSFYFQLAQTEAEVFPCVRKDLDRLLWVPARRSQGFPGYFCEVDDPAILQDVLMKLNMNIIKCPFTIHRSFIRSKVEEVKKVESVTVIEFLKSCHMPKTDTTSCNLKNLPQPVGDTTFGTLGNIFTVFTFIQCECTDLKDLPLSLRMSGQLHCFNSEERTIVSEFCDLLPKSSGLFLHSRLVNFIRVNELFSDYLKKLDITTFLELLPETLPREKFGCGQVLLLSEMTPSDFPFDEKWIERLWTFLQTEGLSGQTWKSGLNEWTLLPALKNTKAVLFPLKNRNDVVHIPEEKAVVSVAVDEDGKINQYLKKLSPNLNKLNTDLLPADCVATQIVASVKNPQELLVALAQGNLQPEVLSCSEAQDMLDFFFRKVHIPLCCSHVRLLPFFQRHDGRQVAVGNTRVHCPPSCVPPIPSKVLQKWSEMKRISLVNYNPRLQQLYQKLGFDFPDVVNFYSSHLLPNIADLPHEAILQHMEYIRDCLPQGDFESLLCSLQKTQFIPGHDGTLHKASDFYSPDCKVFKVMLTDSYFPPQPYCTGKWKVFLQKIGMICSVSEEQFLTFARKVEVGGRRGLSDKLQEQSRQLSVYLKTSGALRGEGFLKELRDIKFLLPLKQREMKYQQTLQLIHPVLKPSTPLVSFSEGLSSCWLFHVWTTGCLLSVDADPSYFHKWTASDMDEWIGFRREPPETLVIPHVKNICQSLGMRKVDGTSLLTGFDDTLCVIGEIMETIYSHLTGFSDIQLKSLRDVNVVLHIERKAMFSCHQVVETILPDQIIENHVVNAPVILGKFFPLFQRLGMCGLVSLDHYARALEEIHASYSESCLHPNDLKLVGVAVDNLFKLLLKSDQENAIARTILYLPAENVSMLNQNISQVKLVDSRKLLVDVNQGHQRRIKTLISDLEVFVSFSRLDLKHHDLQREANLLPEPFRMKQWFVVVKETLAESCITLAGEDEHTHKLTDCLHSGYCVAAVKRIINHQCLIESRNFTEDDANKVEQALMKVRVLKVTNLKTVLQMNKSPLPGTEEPRQCFVTRDNGVVTLYISSTLRGDITFKHISLRRQAVRAVSWAVGFKINENWLNLCLECLSLAQDLLDDENVSPYHIQQQRTVFPPPGSFLPDKMHCLLDHDVYGYKVDEYVAYELYDPLLDPQNPESGEMAEAREGASTEAEGISCDSTGPTSNKKPIYIFAQIRKIIIPPDAAETVSRTRLMLLRYLIDIGEEQYKEVGAMELYKFVRPPSNVVVPFTGDTTSGFTQPDMGDDLKKVLADIRHQLQEIWRSFPDEKNRKRAVKRLLLKWHPDKNPGREPFCTKVFQQIQRYVSLLEQGKPLPSDDDVDNFSSGSGHQDSDGSGFYHNFHDFFDHVFSRGRSYARSRCNFGSGSGSGRSSSSSFSGFGDGWGSSSSSFSFSSHANPQPEEGKRWMRQALQDLKAARLTLNEGGEGLYNWSCYQAHQAVEKALKAFLYRRDVRNIKKFSHEIYSLACDTADSLLQELVKRLESVVQCHTRMRYPDLLVFPMIPSDVYNENEAQEACKLAGEVISRVQELIDTYQTPPRQPTPPPQPQPSSPQRSSTQRSSPRQRAVASSSSRSGGSGLSLTSARRPAVTGCPAVSPPKVPRLDPSIKALPPP